MNGLEEEVGRIEGFYPKLRLKTCKSIVKKFGALYNYWYDVTCLYTHTPVGGISNIAYRYADIVYHREISEVLSQANIGNVVITNKKDIIMFYNTIAKELLRKTRRKLSYFKKYQLLTIMYCIASYIAELHARMTPIIHKKNDVEHFKTVNTNYDEFEYSILKKVEHEKDSSRSRATLETIKGTDKFFIQYIFPIIMTTDTIESHHYDFTSEHFEEIYYLSLTITRLITDQEIVTSKFIGDSKVCVIDNRIELSPDIQKRFFNYLKKQLLESLTKNEVVPEWLIQNLIETSIVFLGFHWRC